MAGRSSRSRMRARDREMAQHNLRILNPTATSLKVGSPMRELERGPGLRFVVRVAGPMTPRRLQSAIRRRHGLLIRVEPLFGPVEPATDVNVMPSYYLVTLPGLSRDDIADNVFDIGYRLRDDTPEAGILSVEPDLPEAVFVGNPEFAVGAALCEVPNDTASQDHYWHLRKMRVDAAWDLELPPGGVRYGEGIVIGHPDTGWAPHLDIPADMLDLSRSWDFVDDDSDARDPLERSEWWDPTTPGHGTATGSVLAGRSSTAVPPVIPEPGPNEGLIGVAPRANLVPIRTVRFVAFVYNADVARAIRHAVDRGCHVISMSLGGLGMPAMEAAVNYAVANNVLVFAAAGNCISFVVAPAIYRNCIAVAGSNRFDQPWPFSSFGQAVDITAPAQHVWVARRFPGNADTTLVTLGQGTSFATAGTAGVAALWLAFHGRDRLLERYRDQVFLQHVFMHIVRTTAWIPPTGWNTDLYGPGIVDAAAVLSAPLPDPSEISVRPTLEALAVSSYAELIPAMFGGLDPGLASAQMAAALGVEPELPPDQWRTRLDAEASRWGPELMHILGEHRTAYLAMRQSVTAAGTAALTRSLEAEQLAVRARSRAGDELRRWSSSTLERRLRGSG